MLHAALRGSLLVSQAVLLASRGLVIHGDLSRRREGRNSPCPPPASDLKLFPVAITQETRNVSSLGYNLPMGRPRRCFKGKHPQEVTARSLQAGPFNPGSKLQPASCAPVPMLQAPDHHGASSRCPSGWLPNQELRLSPLPGTQGEQQSAI